MPIFAAMGFFRFLSPLGAFRDFRAFIATRKKHEIWFLIPALLVTGLILLGFYLDSRAKRAWKRPEIVWVKEYRSDRTDDEIRGVQYIGFAVREKQLADYERRKEERRKDFKQVDDRLKSWGL